MKIYSSLSNFLFIVLHILSIEAMDEFPKVIGFDIKNSIFDFSPISQAREDEKYADVEKLFYNLRIFREIQKERKKKKIIRIRLSSNESIKIISAEQSEE